MLNTGLITLISKSHKYEIRTFKIKRIMKKNTYQDNKISRLERKILNLKAKFEFLTSQIEKVRNNTANNEDDYSTHHLLDERNLLEEQIRRIAKAIKQKEAIKAKEDNLENEKVNFGNKVFLKNHNGSMNVILVEEIVTHSSSYISINSPIGKEVLGKKRGEKITVNTPKGPITYTIKEIS